MANKSYEFLHMQNNNCSYELCTFSQIQLHSYMCISNDKSHDVLHKEATILNYTSTVKSSANFKIYQHNLEHKECPKASSIIPKIETQ